MSDESRSSSGLTGREAQEFHKYFMLGFIIFTAIAVVAHFLVWQWRPWFPGVNGYAALTDGAQLAVQSVLTRLS